MMKIVFLDAATFSPGLVRKRPDFAHEWIEYQQTTADQVVERLKGAQICLTNKVALQTTDLDQLPDLRYIMITATGTNVVDTNECAQRGLAVSNITEYACTSVSEHVFATIGALNRSLVAYQRSIAAGRWQECGQFCFFDHRISDLAGKQLGIIGGGSIGSAVGALGEAFKMRVRYSLRKNSAEKNPTEEVLAEQASKREGKVYLPFEEIIGQSDVITLHCPLTAETRNLIGAAEFAGMKTHCLLINTGRGGLVDEEALVHALRYKQIGGAACDVLSQEPPTRDHLGREHPFLRYEATGEVAPLDMPNFILTPHVAWASIEAMSTLWSGVIECLQAFEHGIVLNKVV